HESSWRCDAIILIDLRVVTKAVQEIEDADTPISTRPGIKLRGVRDVIVIRLYEHPGPHQRIDLTGARERHVERGFAPFCRKYRRQHRGSPDESNNCAGLNHLNAPCAPILSLRMLHAQQRSKADQARDAETKSDRQHRLQGCDRVEPWEEIRLRVREHLDW